jgi:hypothetical protein
MGLAEAFLHFVTFCRPITPTVGIRRGYWAWVWRRTWFVANGRRPVTEVEDLIGQFNSCI